MNAEQLACSKVRLNPSFDVQRGASSSLDEVVTKRFFVLDLVREETTYYQFVPTRRIH